MLVCFCCPIRFFLWQRNGSRDHFKVFMQSCFLTLSTTMSGNEKQIINKIVYMAICIDPNGEKDVLTMRAAKMRVENESYRFRAGVLNSLLNRDIEEILIACTDKTIYTVYSKTISRMASSIGSGIQKMSHIRGLRGDYSRPEKVYPAVDENSALNTLFCSNLEQ